MMKNCIFFVILPDMGIGLARQMWENGGRGGGGGGVRCWFVFWVDESFSLSILLDDSSYMVVSCRWAFIASDTQFKEEKTLV